MALSKSPSESLSSSLHGFAVRIERANGVREVIADIGRHHRAHAELFCGEVSGKSSDIKSGDGSLDCVSAILERAVSLCQEARDESCESIAGARGPEACVA